MTTTSDLQSALVTLHIARMVAAGYVGQKKAAFEAWKAEHKELLDGEVAAHAVLAEADEHARELGLAAFKETGDKRPTLGVEVKDFAHIHIPDEAAALAWAIRHELALKLDTAALGKIAKAQGGIPGVAEMVTEPQVTLATDLGPAVAALSEIEGLGKKEVQGE